MLYLPSHKQDENWFWSLLQEAHDQNYKSRERFIGGGPRPVMITPRDIMARPEFSIPFKRACMMLDKWAGKGWYDYGVTLDLGWITTEGLLILPRAFKCPICAGQNRIECCSATGYYLEDCPICRPDPPLEIDL